MSSYDYVFQEVGSGGTNQPRHVDPSIGTVTRVTAEGVFVMMDDYSDRHEWGPYPWNHASATAPVAGNKVVVVFIGVGIGRGFVTAWAPSVPWE